MINNITLDGTTIPKDLKNQVFYGFKVTPDSQLLIDVIAQGNGVIKLPSETISDPLAYKQWAWSYDTLEFYFSEDGHLNLKII